MMDPVNPTLEEIRLWAYGNEVYYPVDDWDLMVFTGLVEKETGLLVLAIASDRTCPKRPDFLHFLNVMTGATARYAGRDGFDVRRLDVLRAMIAQAVQGNDPDILDWARRTEAVLSDPSTFVYDAWFA